MEREELVTITKDFCKDNSLVFVNDIKVGNSILLLVKGENCKDLLEEHLTSLGLEHTKADIILECFGSYVTL